MSDEMMSKSHSSMVPWASMAIGLLLIVSSVGVFGLSVTGTVSVSNVGVTCSPSDNQGDFLCSSSFTVTNSGGAPNPLRVVFQVDGLSYQPGSGCGSSTWCQVELAYLTETVTSGSSQTVSQGGWNTISVLNPYKVVIYVLDSTGAQASSKVTYQFSPTSSGWTLTMDKPYALGAAGAYPASSCVSPAPGTVSKGPGAVVMLAATNPCVVGTTYPGLSWSFSFAGWELNGVAAYVSTSATYQVTMNGNYEFLPIYNQGVSTCTGSCLPVQNKWYPPAQIDVSVPQTPGVTITTGSQVITSQSAAAGFVPLHPGQSASFTYKAVTGYTLSGWAGWAVFWTSTNQATGAPQGIAGTATSLTLS